MNRNDVTEMIIEAKVRQDTAPSSARFPPNQPRSAPATKKPAMLLCSSNTFISSARWSPASTALGWDIAPFTLHQVFRHAAFTATVDSG